MKESDNGKYDNNHAYHYREGTWTPITTIDNPGEWPLKNGYEFESTIDDCMWIYQKTGGIGHAFVICLSPIANECTLVIVDSFPDEAQFLRDINGHLSLWKLRHLEEQTDIMKRDFVHNHDHYPCRFERCPTCDEYFDVPDFSKRNEE